MVFATLAVCLGMLEIGLRVTGRFIGNSLTGYYAQGKTSYRLSKNVSKTVHWPTTTFTVNTDQMGFRSQKAGPRELGRKPYYAVLGSSDAFGDGLSYEQTFVGVFAENMEPHGIDVVNMGVGGHALDEQSDILKEYADSAKIMPEQVIICLNPRMIFEFDERHERVVVRHGNLFSKSNWRFLYLRRILESDFASYCFFRDAFRNIQLRYFNRRDFDTDFWVETYSTMNSIRSPKRTKVFLEHLKQLENYIRSLKATPVCVYCPTVGGFVLNKMKAEGMWKGPEFDTAFYPELLQAHCKAEGIQLINGEPILQKLYDQGKTLNLKLDAHFNSGTSHAVGELLYSALERTGSKPTQTARN